MREKIEALFESLARFAVTRPGLTVVACGVVCAALLTQISSLEIETRPETMLHPDDPARELYDDFLARFGQDMMVLIAVEPRAAVFDADFLELLRAFLGDLEREVPHLAEVESLLTARSTRGVDDELIVEDLFERWPENAQQLAALEARALANPLYRNLWISADGRMTAVSLRARVHADTSDLDDVLEGFDDPSGELDGEDETGGSELRTLSNRENAEFVHAIEAVVARHESPAFRLHLTGGPVLSEVMQRAIQADLRLFSALSVLVIGVCLMALFRRVIAVVLPLLVVVLALVGTFGAMGALGIPITVGTQILPSFLLAVGVGYAVHVLSVFLQRVDQGVEQREAVVGAIRHSGLPIGMTALTTAGGLSSFAGAELQPVAALGQFAPVGIGFALFLSVFLLPALLALWPVRPRPRASSGEGLSERLLIATGGFSGRHPGPCLFAACAVAVVAVIGTLQLRVSHEPMLWFSEDNPIRRATDAIERGFVGSTALELLVTAEQDNALKRPEVLRAIDETAAWTLLPEHAPVRVGKSLSLADIVKEIHQALNEGRPEAYGIPDEPALVAQELLLFENAGSEDLAKVTDGHFGTGRVTLRIGQVDATLLLPFAAAVRERLGNALGEGFRVDETGMVAVMNRTLLALIQSMSRSYVIALLVITPLMILLIGSLRTGLVSMVPNLLPILLTLGLMGWADIPLDSFTLLTGSIALGLAVDDTIHFLHCYRREVLVCGDAEAAIREALRTTGRALFFTSLVLCAGFSVFAFSELANLIWFGVLTAFAIAAAFVCDIVLSPMLVRLVSYQFASTADAPEPRPEQKLV